MPGLPFIANTRPRLYFVKMDIRAAFDTINQDKVLQVIDSLLDEDYNYLLMLYSLLLPPASGASQG
jgi:telomerase reverse transcriptase